MAILLPQGKQQYFTAAGVPLVGGRLWTLDAGTVPFSFPRTTYQDAAGTIPNANPIILDARGEATIYWAGSYKVVLQDALSATIWTQDNVSSISGANSVLDNYSIDSGAANAYVVAAATPMTAYVAGLRVAVKVINTNTAASTLNYMGLGVRNITLDGHALSGGEIQTGGVYTLEYDGAVFHLLNATDPAKVRTSAEIAAAVVPSNYSFFPGDVRRYGAILNGITDDTAALIRWASVGGNLVFPVPSTALITAAIPLQSNSTLTAVEGATVQTATVDISFFTASAKTKIKVSGFKFRQTVAGAAAYVAGVALTSCTHCEVSGNEFEGMQWTGIYLDSSNNCDVLRNYIHDSLATVAGDTSDICVYRNSSFNRVAFNRCYGTGFFGVLVQDPGGVGTFLPQKNKVHDNRVTAHSGYGIAVYVGGAVHSYNYVAANEVEGITGSAGSFYGSGIYAVGAGIGGLQILNNNVRNCCSATTTRLNAPAGIGVSDVNAGVVKPIISGNTIDGMTQGDGILLATCPGGAVITNNVIRMPASNNGTGPGGATLAGNGIRLENASNVDVDGNDCIHLGAQDAVLSLATSGSQSNIAVTDNTVASVQGSPVRFARAAAFTFTRCTVSGNIGVSASNTPRGMEFTALVDAAVVGNSVSVGSNTALYVADCTGTRIAANRLVTTGAEGVVTVGVCTDSQYSLSNSHVGYITNGATGLRTQFYASAVPATGQAAVGDMAFNSAPVAAGTPGWVCTTAGTPGTWKARANVAP